MIAKLFAASKPAQKSVPVFGLNLVILKGGLLAVTIALMGGLLGSAQSQAQNRPAGRPTIAEGILVSVNNDIISSYDLKQRMQLLMVTSEVQVTQENFQVFQQQALRSLVEEKLKLQELKHWKLEISDEEVDQEIERMANQSGMTGEQLLAEFKKAGIEPATFRQQIRAEIGWQRLVNGRFRSSAKVGKDQVDAQMDKLIEDSQKPQYEVAEIYIEAAVVGSMDNALRGAQQLYTQIVNKTAPFQAVARQFSNAPSASNGGMAGFWVSGEIDPALEEKLQQMTPGQMSAPIVTKDGVYLIYLISKTDGNADIQVRTTRAHVPLSAQASDAEVSSAQNQLLRVKSSAVCGTHRNFQDGAVKVTDLGNVDISSLNPNYGSVLKPLKPGNHSQVVRTSTGLSVFYICDRRLADENAPSREDIENRLISRRLAMLSKRYLRDLQTSSTIDYHF